MIDIRDLTDDELAFRAKTGGEVEFAALLARYLFHIKSRASFYNTDETEFDDLVQEGTLGFLRAVRTYDPQAGASFRTYAGLCIDRSIITAVKRSLARRCIPTAVRVSMDEVEVQDFDTPERVLVAKEELQHIMQSLDTVLSDFERSVLLRFSSGESYAEIAEHMQITQKSVGNALYRIRKKISH